MQKKILMTANYNILKKFFKNKHISKEWTSKKNIDSKEATKIYMKKQKKIHAAPKSSKNNWAGENSYFNYIRKYQLGNPCLKPLEIWNADEGN